MSAATKPLGHGSISICGSPYEDTRPAAGKPEGTKMTIDGYFSSFVPSEYADT